ncbi:hypothetical protein, partial [Megamonas rupellensis]|uniref:hypothetical protein n=1 Tax=Megamonas rupellensis TaxID=491921 RepID=UPI00195BC615
GHQPSLERYSKTCYFSRQVSFVSKNPLHLGMGSMSKKLKAFFSMYAPKLYVLLGEHGDMSFQFKLKEKIRKNIYKFFHLDKNDLKAELAVEFFINGHLNALLYMYKYKDRLSIEDYLEIVKPVINNIFVLKNRQ